MTTEGDRLDPVVRTFMQMLQEGHVDYVSRIQELDGRIRELKSGRSPKKPGEGGLSKLIGFGKYCIEWYQGKHTHDKYYRTPPEFVGKPVSRDTQLKSLLESARKLTEAKLLVGGAEYTALGQLRVTIDQIATAKREMKAI